MSNYRTQINKYLSNQEITANSILAIGIEQDDKKMFKSVNCQEWVTLDYDPALNPDICHDINKPLMDDDGDIKIDHKYFEHFDVVIALNLFDYIWDPMQAHDNFYNLLKNDGILITNYPFVYPMHKPKGIDYLRFTPDAVNLYLKKSYFKILERVDILGNELLLDFYQLDGMHKLPEVDHRLIGMIIKAKKI